MIDKAKELLKEALTLPVQERAELASSLIISMDLRVSDDVEAAWQEEIGRRVERIRAGTATLIPWDEVREKARTILDEKAG